jgi:hypothetical protein
MSGRDARLAWTLLLAPRDRWAERLPPWPALLRERFGEPRIPEPDPIQRVLVGPLPQMALSRQRRDEGPGILLHALGDRVGVSGIASREGPYEGEHPSDDLRRFAADALLRGLDADPRGAPADAPDQVISALSTDSDWELSGVVEVAAALFEGLAADEAPGTATVWVDGVRLERASGVGAGHVAFSVLAPFTNRNELLVGARRVVVLTEGHQSLAPALVCYGADAIRWGAGIREAGRRAAALDLLLPQAEAASSWALLGGPWPGGGAPDIPRIVARLETLRVGLVGDLEALRSRLPALRRAAARVLGEGATLRAEGPLLEASPVAEDAMARLEAREAAAARWVAALRAAQSLPAPPPSPAPKAASKSPPSPPATPAPPPSKPARPVRGGRKAGGRLP